MLLAGIDDTDSAKGMCTTYIGAVLAERLSGFCEVANLRLLRLNPNIKWKTRGNASVCLVLRTKKPAKAKSVILETIQENAVLKDPKTNPGVVFYEGTPPREFKDFYWRCLREVVRIRDAEKLAIEHGAEAHKFKNGRGVIGALAALGSDLPDKTYELIAYRNRENWGKKRRVDPASVYRMDAHTYPLTFNNVDHASSRILITPHSPCPVLLGIRGENRWVLTQAFKKLVINEPVAQKVIYETNQGTDAHLQAVQNVAEIRPRSSAILEGRVTRAPRIIEGGHVIFSISDGDASVDCAAYEPTKGFRWKVACLVSGDAIRVYGGVRHDHPLTVNLEKIDVLGLEEVYEERNPRCGKCGKRMKSAGRNQGLRCKKCDTRKHGKIRVLLNRGLKKKTYQVPPSAMRHLSKPLVRVGFIT
jgi:tRNA(Ile2)-agmatinylcytidine synthase